MQKGTVWVIKEGREFSIANHPVLIKKYIDNGYEVFRMRDDGRKIYC